MKLFSRRKKGNGRTLHHDTAHPVSSAEQDGRISTSENDNGSAISLDIDQPRQSLQLCSRSPNRTEKHGLFLLNPRIPESDDVEAEETYFLDIVALHGINGDAYKTWTHENGKFWLRDFVPTEFSGARVFSFGYPAEVFFSLGKDNLDSYARSLLEDLKRERRKEVGRQFI